MDKDYVTYVDDEHADNHDHDNYYWGGDGGDLPGEPLYTFLRSPYIYIYSYIYSYSYIYIYSYIYSYLYLYL